MIKTKTHIRTITGADDLIPLGADAILATLEDLAEDADNATPVKLDIKVEEAELTSDGRFAVVKNNPAGNEIFPRSPSIDIYEVAQQRNRFTDSEKLAIITEHLCGGNTLDAVQRRHGLGHSTLTAWMKQYGITPRNDEASRRAASLERENARLTAALAQQSAANEALRAENARLLTKIRAARAALVLADPQMRNREETGTA